MTENLVWIHSRRPHGASVVRPASSMLSDTELEHSEQLKRVNGDSQTWLTASVPWSEPMQDLYCSFFLHTRSLSWIVWTNQGDSLGPKTRRFQTNFTRVGRAGASYIMCGNKINMSSGISIIPLDNLCPSQSTVFAAILSQHVSSWAFFWQGHKGVQAQCYRGTDPCWPHL